MLLVILISVKQTRSRENLELTLSADKGLGAHSSQDLGEHAHLDGIVERQTRHGRRKRRAVQETKMLLRRKLEGLNSSRLERSTRRRDLPGSLCTALTMEDPNLLVTKDGTSNVRKRREVCKSEP